MANLKTACDLCGGQAALADQIGVKQQHVWNWLNRPGGVPPEHCAAIQSATKGAVMRWDLRPDDWWRIWPELIGTPLAPAIPEHTDCPARNVRPCRMAKPAPAGRQTSTISQPSTTA